MGESLLRLLFFWGGLLFFLILELLRPYRVPSVSKPKRWAHNLALALFNTLLLQAAFGAFTAATLIHVGRNQVGLLHLLAAPVWLELLLTVAFLDFMLYVWHLLNHEVPLLWRFHRVHHTDLNMDASTATRFHAGELAVSAVIKIALIYLIGADLRGLVLFETLTVLCAQLHHSSLKVPAWFERLWWPLFVPPSMHRIHHSVVIRERNTNYGVIFSLWDRLLGTLRRDVEQARIRIGVGGHMSSAKLTFPHLLAMPFTRAVR